MTAAQRPTPPTRTRWPFVVLFGALGAVVVGVVVLAFVWPSATARARDLPVGIAGPADRVAQLKARAAEQDPDPFAFRTVGSRAQAVGLIRRRELSGAFLLGTRTEVLVASAGSTAASQALRGVAASLATAQSQAVEAGQARAIAGQAKAIAGLTEQLAALQAQARAGGSAGGAGGSSAVAGGSATSGSGGSSTSAAASTTLPSVVVTDVVPLAADDPTGGGLTAAAFPLVLGGMLGGVLISLLVVGVVRRVAALLLYAIGAGALIVVVLQTLFHVLQRDWIVNAAAASLALLATAALVVGFNSLLGPRGIAVGAVISVLVGNPISGAAIPYQFIPAPWGDVGQYFVAGASANLVRSLSYFPDAAVGKQWAVLAAWAAGGLVLTIVGHFRNSAPVPLPADELVGAGRVAPRGQGLTR